MKTVAPVFSANEAACAVARGKFVQHPWTKITNVFPAASERAAEASSSKLANLWIGWFVLYPPNRICLSIPGVASTEPTIA